MGFRSRLSFFVTSGPVSRVVEPRRMSSKPTQRLTWKVKAEIKHEVKQEEHPEMFSLEEHRTSDAVWPLATRFRGQHWQPIMKRLQCLSISNVSELCFCYSFHLCANYSSRMPALYHSHFGPFRNRGCSQPFLSCLLFSARPCCYQVLSNDPDATRCRQPL